MRSLVSLVAVGAIAGCYVYRPIDTVEPRVGTRVAADLTDVGSDTLARYVGPGVTSLRGGVVNAEPATVTIAITSVMDRSGQQQFWKGEEVRIPRVAVRDFAQRRFSLGRSVLLGAALLGSALVAWEAFQGGIHGGRLMPGGVGGGTK